LTAQTTEGSAREEQMKNFTAKAKERLADVESKVNKQLTKELDAKTRSPKPRQKLRKLRKIIRKRKRTSNKYKRPSSPLKA